MQLISQIIGIAVAVAAVLSMQLKNVKSILICQLLCNGLGALSYLLLNELSGFMLHAVAVCQTLVFYIIRQKEIKAPKYVSWIFVVLFVGCSALSYKSPVDLFSAFSALMFSLSICCEKPSRYRAFMLFNGISWVLYDVNVAAYSMIITHALLVVSTVAGIIRLDLKKKSA